MPAGVNGRKHRTIGGPEAWLVRGLCTAFVVWLFAGGVGPGPGRARFEAPPAAPSPH